MAVPKRKTSKSKSSRRKRAHRTSLAAIRPCPQCGAAQRPHRVCQSCGMYRGRQVVSVTAEE